MFSREFRHCFPHVPFPKFAFWAQTLKKLVNIAFWRNVNFYRTHFIYRVLSAVIYAGGSTDSVLELPASAESY